MYSVILYLEGRKLVHYNLSLTNSHIKSSPSLATSIYLFKMKFVRKVHKVKYIKE